MRLVFFGTPAFAAHSLKRLLQSKHTVAAVVTQPDRPKGRSPQGLSPSAVKEVAQASKIPLDQPEKLNDPTLHQNLKALAADCAVVVAYGGLLPLRLIQLFPKGALNLHPSLLPKLRGAAPIQWALISGDSETGVTIFQMDEQMDHGPILLQTAVPIDPNDTAVSLTVSLAEKGAALLGEALDRLENQTLKSHPQEESKVTYAPRLKKEDGILHWQESADKIHHRVRGVQPWPGALTWFQGKQLKVFSTQPDLKRHDPTLSPGTVATADPSQGLWIQTGKGQIRMDRLQWESGKVLDTAEFLRGHPIRPGHRMTPGSTKNTVV